jgi:hypothetical protein
MLARGLAADPTHVHACTCSTWQVFGHLKAAKLLILLCSNSNHYWHRRHLPACHMAPSNDAVVDESALNTVVVWFVRAKDSASKSQRQ